MLTWTTEYRSETGLPDEFFVRVYPFEEKWAFQFYDYSSEFVEDAEGAGFATPESAQENARRWYAHYISGDMD